MSTAKNTRSGMRSRIKQERRRSPRIPLGAKSVGILHDVCSPTPESGPEAARECGHRFVEVLDTSDTGASFVFDRPLEIGATLNLMIQDKETGAWTGYGARVVRRQDHPGPDLSQIGLEFTEEEPGSACQMSTATSNRAHVADLDFLTGTSLLSSIPSQSLFPLLNCLSSRRLDAEERLIVQGESGDRLFLVQEGECAVRVESDGEIFQMARIRPGDVVGEMAVLTGEPRTAHVDALTPLKVWELLSDDFERVAAQYPDIRIFLTELITNRFENSPHTADRKVGKFTIKEPMGKGGWSIVYRGVHSRLDFPVAIKMMRHDMAMETDFITTFRTEAELIAPMNHPNIVQVYDIDELYRTVFIVMEYLEGGSLDSVLEHRGMLSPSRTLNILVQICDGLAYAHDRGIVHRDIKPANIFVLAEDRIKILDFGLACAPGTEDMSLAGTVKYAPPEQIEGDPVDGRADLYSLGIMAYEMITGQRPYPEDDIMRLMDLHCEEDIPDPALLVPDIPEGLRDFILKACRRDPDERYESATAARAALEAVSRSLGLDVERAQPLEHHMTSAFVFYSNAQKQDMTRLLEEFSTKAHDLGITVKVADFKDVL